MPNANSPAPSVGPKISSDFAQSQPSAIRKRFEEIEVRLAKCETDLSDNRTRIELLEADVNNLKETKGKKNVTSRKGATNKDADE